MEKIDLYKYENELYAKKVKYIAKNIKTTVSPTTWIMWSDKLALFFTKIMIHLHTASIIKGILIAHVPIISLKEIIKGSNANSTANKPL